MLLKYLAIGSGLSFAVYGCQTVFGDLLKKEFEQYGMAPLRRSVGSLQLLGAAGLFVGLRYSVIGALAASGLSAMMLLALVARLIVRDNPRLMIPAASFAVVNMALVALFIAA